MLKVIAACAAALIATGAVAQDSLLERGSYLVNNIGACGNCHTPRVKGVPDLSQRFSGGSGNGSARRGLKNATEGELCPFIHSSGAR